ncbi:MAG: hypothetical protein WC412_02185 [Candidatus Omnitrophota bacterium]
MNKKSFFKKANVFAEYAILISIIVAVISGVSYFLKRSIQERVRMETLEHIEGGGLYSGHGLEWGSSLTFSSSDSTLEKNEEFGGNAKVTAESQMGQTTLQAPVPSIQGWSVMEHKGSALSVQDAPSAAPAPDYPSLEYKDWNDKNWIVS